jgi:hypothetical protein
MSKRFGRNQKRKLMETLEAAKRQAQAAEYRVHSAENKLKDALRDQLAKGVIPLEVEHFLSRDGRNIVIHAIYDERRSNLHYQHEISPREIQLKRDADERDAFAMYLGRAIADRIAEACAGVKEGRSKAA